MQFRSCVSKGSRFNQVYIPKSMEKTIEPGDLVEVRLLKKRFRLFYSKNLQKLTEFKESIIKRIFSITGEFENVETTFIVGSFLAEKIDYNDIDVVLLVSKKSESLEKEVYSQLVNELNLKFHILAIEKQRFGHLIEACPLTRVMFSSFISSKETAIPEKRVIDKNHIKFLLMMPSDLLEIKLSSRAFYDSLRRLITIEKFLDNQALDVKIINSELNKLIGDKLFQRIKNNEEIEQKSIDDLRKIIKDKIGKIYRLL